MPSHTPPLPADSRIGTVRLRVSDLDGLSRWYEDVLGFHLLAEDGATAALSAGSGRPLLVLHADADAVPRRRGAPGLFHVAFLLPDRRSLGEMILRVKNAGGSFDGYADHNVSEAVYLSDPEGNGLELYADRSPDVWRTVDGSVFMTTEPLDVDGLLVAASGPAPALPEGTTVGHIHLSVSTLAAADAFYHGRLGFGMVSRRYPGALFMAAGDYHHHVGCNVWGVDAGAARPPRARGLMSFDVMVPREDARRGLLGGADEGLLLDPDENEVRIVRG